MKAKNKPRRRRGLLADELAKEAQTSRYMAKQAIAVSMNAPELVPFVMSGQLKLRQAAALVHAPELIPYVVSGELPCSECDLAIRAFRQLGEPELSFEEEVERSYKRWLARWPKEDREEVNFTVAFMPPEKLADLLPSQNLAVENDLENKPTEKGKQPP